LQPNCLRISHPHHARYMPPPISSSLISSALVGEEYKLWSSPNILLCTLFSNILNLCSLLNVKDQVSHPYKTTRKIIVLYVLIFTFLCSGREGKRF
jgi:hypothetical protein